MFLYNISLHNLKITFYFILIKYFLVLLYTFYKLIILILNSICIIIYHFISKFYKDQKHQKYKFIYLLNYCSIFYIIIYLTKCII